MGQKSVVTSPTPVVSIENVMGSLQVKGWDRDVVLLRTESDPLGKLEGSGDQVRITCQGTRVQIVWNGEPVVDFAEANRSPRGYLGLQNHDASSVVRFRNLRLTE